MRCDFCKMLNQNEINIETKTWNNGLIGHDGKFVILGTT